VFLVVPAHPGSPGKSAVKQLLLSEMCCTQLTGNTGCKNYAKNRDLRTITQLCQAMSSQLRHASTIGNGSQPNFARYLAVSCTGTQLYTFSGLLPCNGILPGAKYTLRQVLLFPILAALLRGTREVIVSQTLRL